MIDKLDLQTTEESKTKSPVQKNTENTENESTQDESFESVKYFESGKLGLMEENPTIWLKAESRREIEEEHDGDISTVLVLGGFAAMFVLTCFIWTGMNNFRARRREKQIEKIKLSLVTKL